MDTYDPIPPFPTNLAELLAHDLEISSATFLSKNMTAGIPQISRYTPSAVSMSSLSSLSSVDLAVPAPIRSGRATGGYLKKQQQQQQQLHKKKQQNKMQEQRRERELEALFQDDEADEEQQEQEEERRFMTMPCRESFGRGVAPRQRARDSFREKRHNSADAAMDMSLPSSSHPQTDPDTISLTSHRSLSDLTLEPPTIHRTSGPHNLPLPTQTTGIRRSVSGNTVLSSTTSPDTSWIDDSDSEEAVMPTILTSRPPTATSHRQMPEKLSSRLNSPLLTPQRVESPLPVPAVPEVSSPVAERRPFGGDTFGRGIVFQPVNYQIYESISEVPEMPLLSSPQRLGRSESAMGFRKVEMRKMEMADRVVMGKMQRADSLKSSKSERPVITARRSSLGPRKQSLVSGRLSGRSEEDEQIFRMSQIERRRSRVSIDYSFRLEDEYTEPAFSRSILNSRRPSLGISKAPSFVTPSWSAPALAIPTSFRSSTRAPTPDPWKRRADTPLSAGITPSASLTISSSTATPWPSMDAPALQRYPEPSRTAFPLPPDIADNLRVNISCFPETLLLCSSLTIETIRSYSRKVKKGTLLDKELAAKDTKSPSKKWRLGNLIGRRVPVEKKEENANSNVNATPYLCLRSIFAGADESLCDALYAHLIAYNYIGALCSGRRPSIPGSSHSNASSLQQYQHLAPSMTSSSSHSHEDSPNEIPKKAAHLLGLSSPTASSPAPPLKRPAKTTRKLIRGAPPGSSGSMASIASNGFISGQHDSLALREIQTGLEKCIARLVVAMRGEGVLEEEDEGADVDPLLLKSLGEIVKNAEEN